MEVDYLILGQGISGTLLSYYLLKEGRSVAVVDNDRQFTSSRVAGGIVNPVTGKRLVRSWMIDDLLPFARNAYRDLERELDISIVRERSILEFHATLETAGLFHDKVSGGSQYLHSSTNGVECQNYFRFNYGVGEIAPCLLVDLASMLGGWRAKLKENGAFVETEFSWSDCLIEREHVVYKNIRAQKFICCEGASGADNPYFDRLPWAKDKGEALIVAIPGLPRNHIYKQGISIVPWRDDLFWIGATHDWKFTDLTPSPAFRKSVELQLDYWLQLPYTIIDHIVAQRPANVDRKPFVGIHPNHPSIGIFNGMGGKGISMAPYFAHQFASHLVNGSPILADVDIARFGRILTR